MPQPCLTSTEPRHTARRAVITSLAALLALAACTAAGRDGETARAGDTAAAATTATTQEPAMSLTLTSTAFALGAEIPTRFTCEGEDVSPALSWSGAPAGTRSLALTVADPDAPDPKAPKLNYTHWVLYDIPADATGLPEGVASSGLPAGTREGHNDWKRTGYGGPCPPIGRHRYFHRLYALDTLLGDLGAPTREQLERAMEGHVLATAELMGTYEKKKP